MVPICPIGPSGEVQCGMPCLTIDQNMFFRFVFETLLSIKKISNFYLKNEFQEFLEKNLPYCQTKKSDISCVPVKLTCLGDIQLERCSLFGLAL